MIHSDAELRRKEEWEAQQWLLQREAANELRAQLQAAVELLRERMGCDPNPALVERVERNRASR